MRVGPGAPAGRWSSSPAHGSLMEARWAGLSSMTSPSGAPLVPGTLPLGTVRQPGRRAAEWEVCGGESLPSAGSRPSPAFDDRLPSGRPPDRELNPGFLPAANWPASAPVATVTLAIRARPPPGCQLAGDVDGQQAVEDVLLLMHAQQVSSAEDWRSGMIRQDF